MNYITIAITGLSLILIIAGNNLIDKQNQAIQMLLNGASRIEEDAHFMRVNIEMHMKAVAERRKKKAQEELPFKEEYSKDTKQKAKLYNDCNVYNSRGELLSDPCQTEDSEE